MYLGRINSLNGDIEMRDIDCDPHYCDFEIYDGNKKIFEIGLEIVDNNVVILRELNIQRPLTINAKFDIQC